MSSVKHVMYMKKFMFGIILHVAVKMENIYGFNSAIFCDEVIESYEEKTNFNKKKATCKTQNFYILLTFLLITIELLIAVSIYCYSIKQKHLLPFHFTNNKLKEIIY